MRRSCAQYKWHILLVLLSVMTGGAYAQAPANDNCSNASLILITGKGFDYGTFTSLKFAVDAATREKGEKCSKELEETGNCYKTVWYKFYIPTSRDIAVKLTQQDSAIPQIFAGFNIYRIPDCNYTIDDLSEKLTPLNKFGETGNGCLEQGWYLVQVGIKEKAKGVLWVELSSQPQQGAQSYDKLASLYDMGIVKDRYDYATLSAACASVSREEAEVIQDEKFSKSLFCKYTLPANSVMNKVLIQGNGELKYRLFTGNINEDSVKSSKPFIHIKAAQNFGYSEEILNEICPAKSVETSYYLQLLPAGNDNYNTIVSVNNATYTADKWTTPGTDDIITTDNNFNRSKRHYFNCDAFFKNHGCKPLIPDYYAVKLWGSYYDTCTTGGYTVINAAEDGLLNVQCNTDNGSAYTMYYLVYEGDISKGCNLKLLTSEYSNYFSYCVKKDKVYTLVTAMLGKYSGGNVFTSFIHNISQRKPSADIIHYKPYDPEKFPDFKPSVQSSYTSKRINFNTSKDTSFKVDTVKVKGCLVYREFRLTETSDIIISENNFNFMQGFYLFKGRISAGAIGLIPGVYYYGPSYRFQLPDCGRLAAGYYTIISILDTSVRTPACQPPETQIILQAPFKCDASFSNNEPAKAEKINNNVDVLSSAANKKNLDYVYDLRRCEDCSRATVNKPFISCAAKRGVTAQTVFSYHTFYLSVNAEMRIPSLVYPYFELYKGNVLQDNALVKDSNNIIAPCDRGNVFCNLEGGRYYTIVLFNLPYSNSIEVFFTRHRLSPNDYAAQAFDFGHFGFDMSILTPPLPVTCHTNGLASDPCASMFGWAYYCEKPSTVRNIPYKDTQNYKREDTRRNLWYTFTVEDAADLRLEVSAPGGFISRNPMLAVYRYKGAYDRNFRNVLAGNFDSTIRAMEFIAVNPMRSGSDYRESYIDFINEGCSKSRYFIILDEAARDPAHYEYVLKLSYKRNTQLSARGDLCSDPETVNYTTYGTKQVYTDNTCHTYGNSPFEQDKREGIKTSWFKIHVSGLKTFDLSIKNLYPSLKYYTVYGGDCGAMTRVAKLGDAYSYFTLSCMGSGDYYIQAVCDNIVTAAPNPGFEIIVKKAENTSCKPYDFDNPIAQYTINGGCNGDTIRFNNLSTYGVNTTYQWKINNVLFSTDYHSILLRSDPRVKKTNTIKLIVRNTAKNTVDSSIMSYVKDTSTYSFKISGPSLVYCMDTFQLKVNTNFPDKINYSWSASNGQQYSRPLWTIQNQYGDQVYYVKGESDNCFFEDSIKIRMSYSKDIYRDTLICPGEPYIIYVKPGEILNINNQTVTDSYKIEQPGVYYIYTYSNGCQNYDTMTVGIDTTPRYIYQKSTVYACNTNSVMLKYPGKLLKCSWNTGENTPEIAASQTGRYIMNGDISVCRKVEYTVNLTIDKVSHIVLRDTILCVGDTLVFKNPKPGFIIDKQSPAENSIRVMSPLNRMVTLRKDRCIISDTSLIDIYPSEAFTWDTLYCDSLDNFHVMLDAGIAKSYYWLEDEVRDRFFEARKYGVYKVERVSMNNCKDTSSLSVTNNCDFNVFIPNVFSPNRDGHNELFSPVISGQFTAYDMTLFNRWGEIVYKTTGSESWNGFYKNEIAEQGVYAYLITVHRPNGGRFHFRGTFTLLR